MGNVAHQDSTGHRRNVLSTQSSGLHNKGMGSFQDIWPSRFSKPLNLTSFLLLFGFGLFPRSLRTHWHLSKDWLPVFAPFSKHLLGCAHKSVDIQVKIKV